MVSLRRVGFVSSCRAIAALRPDAWLPGSSSRSRTKPLVTPARVSAAATEAPARPPPITTTSTSDGIRPRGAIPSVYGGTHLPAAGGVCVADEDILPGHDRFFASRPKFPVERPPTPSAIAFGVATLLTLLTRARDLSQDKLSWTGESRGRLCQESL